MSSGPPKKSNEKGDCITYLPVDATASPIQRYAPTDPRTIKTIGGMRLGSVPVFVNETELPALEPSSIAQALDYLVTGEKLLIATLCLARVPPEQADWLIVASQGKTMRERWMKLWVACAHLARIARSQLGREKLTQALSEDLDGLQLLCKFIEQESLAAKLLFKRLKFNLLTMLFGKVHAAAELGETAHQAISLIGDIEVREDILQQSLANSGWSPQVQAHLLSLVHLRRVRPSRGKLQPFLIRQKLENGG